MKKELKGQALQLRNKGFSYSQILTQVPVARSTLSLWLRSVGLSKRQRQRLTEKRLLAARRGSQIRREQKIQLTKAIKNKARLEIDEVNKRELWFMGVMLYWAEGSKEKSYSAGQNIIFSNSDPMMIKLFLKWLKDCLNITSDSITFQIYIHDNNKSRLKEVISYWRYITGFSEEKFGKIYYKRHKPLHKRKNISQDYHGLLRVGVKKSSNLNRKISGWIEGVCMQCGVV